MRHTTSRHPALLHPPNTDAGDGMAGVGATGMTGTTVNRDSTASHRCVRSACAVSWRSADAAAPATEGGTAETTTRVRFKVLMMLFQQRELLLGEPRVVLAFVVEHEHVLPHGGLFDACELSAEPLAARRRVPRRVAEIDCAESQFRDFRSRWRVAHEEKVRGPDLAKRLAPFRTREAR